MSDGAPLIAARAVGKTFGQGLRALVAVERFDLDVRPGEFVAILGPSGCGKSTFLHMIGGFEPLSAGEITYRGRPVRKPDPRLGMVFQDGALFPWLTVEENVGWPLKVRGLSRAGRAARVAELLSLIGLPHAGHLYPSQLSGGMRQRTALARLLALDPDVMLMDEPFGALDAQTRGILQEELLALWRQVGKTVLFVTHDIEEAVFLATRIVVFTARPGRLKAEFTVDRGDADPFAFRRMPGFLEMRNAVWDCLREEVQRVRDSELAG